MRSLEWAAKSRGFRSPWPDESEAHYRDRLADFVFPKDRVESMEIRTGQGWDKHDPFSALTTMGLDLRTLLGDGGVPVTAYAASLRKVADYVIKRGRGVSITLEQMRLVLDLKVHASRLRQFLGFLGPYSEIPREGSEMQLIHIFLEQCGVDLVAGDEAFYFTLPVRLEIGDYEYMPLSDNEVLEIVL